MVNKYERAYCRIGKEFKRISKSTKRIHKDMKLLGQGFNFNGFVNCESDEWAGISGTPYAWYRADTLDLNDDDTVATWEDSSGNNRDITATGSARPLFKDNIMNGKPVVRFDGIDNFMTSSAAIWGTISQPVTAFVVYDYTLNGGYANIISHGGGGLNNFWLWNFINQPLIRLAGPTQVFTNKQHTLTPDLVTARWNGSNSWVELNGAQSAAVNVGAGSMGGITIGAATGGASRNAQIDVAEIIIYAGAEDTAQNEALLNTKYNLGI